MSLKLFALAFAGMAALLLTVVGMALLVGHIILGGWAWWVKLIACVLVVCTPSAFLICALVHVSDRKKSP